MRRRRYTEEQIVWILGEADSGVTVENRRLKQIVAKQQLEIEAVKHVLNKKW